jgi:WXG100 family type VII secretion target
MVTAANQVESALGEIRGLQTRLTGINDDLAGSWKGEAAAAFGNAYARFSSDFTVVITALQGIQERLTGSHSNYNAAENANTESVNRISAALNR